MGLGTRPKAIEGADAPQLSPTQAELEQQLHKVIVEALPWVQKVAAAVAGAECAYREIAKVLIALRHEFRGPNGERYDLGGRSSGYRALVGRAYSAAGADPTEPIAKKLTAGAAYWTRKLLLERYGEQKLIQFGILRSRDPRVDEPIQRELPRDPQECLSAVVGALSVLAADPSVIPDEDIVRAAIRAVQMLKQKLTAQKGASERSSDSSIRRVIPDDGQSRTLASVGS